MMRPETQVKTWAAELGFDECRIARANEATHAEDFREWIEAGKHGDMAWLERTPERRCNPREVLHGCQSIICLALNYFPGRSPFSNEHPGGYRIARYAWNDDYHALIERRLRDFDEKLQTLGGLQKPYVDTGPVLERDFASDAGLGWNGKSTMQIHKRLGTWFFLAEILTTLDLTNDEPFGDHCGKCTRCITACPTRAITAPRRLDARRCISYLTIELKGSIPVELRPLIGNRVYGCDDCQLICPWNGFAQVSGEPDFRVRNGLDDVELVALFAWDVDEFESRLAGSAIHRIGHERWLRNLAVGLGNAPRSNVVLAALRSRSEHPSALVREHVAWALQKQLEQPTGTQ